jgi:hypothetical protein
MPLLERLRVEVYIPDLPHQEYWGLLYSFQEEFSYAFGGCSVLRGIDGRLTVASSQYHLAVAGGCEA